MISVESNGGMLDTILQKNVLFFIKTYYFL